ncbi:MAG: aminopeptidase N [Gammaproteobacteria bacterium]|nr:aminopeptidase N [Gammaproteobacteria bacterium]
MRKQTPKTIYLKDYRPPQYLIDRVDLLFVIEDEHTRVRSRLSVRRTQWVPKESPLILDGHKLNLQSITVDGQPLSKDRYSQDEESLTINKVPTHFTLEIETLLHPQDNTALEGLYQSGALLCTQCEAQGFRHITYYLDRPDVMAHFTTLLVADRSRYPVLLANGNKLDSGELPNNRHWVKWQDPFKKPSYLFALVAGDLARIEDRYRTTSGREVQLHLYSEPENIDQCDHAMASLKRAMQWDEDRFALEYDLDIYMIVAVGSFNMGAMENKGLNIFNTSCVLARADSATDQDFERVEAVIGHEYFHNWTGNRVTCRDWFQLSLKEGLTVFRDQEFTADLHSRAVKRITDVRTLRNVQFPEDAGPMAHPVRPQSYMEISNFYTVTVYEKGAEVVRMIHSLVGEEGFRRGLKLYLERHDGDGVTTDEFVAAMADANNKDLKQFKRWYDQAGTPRLEVDGIYDADKKTYTLDVKQINSDTSKPLHLPFAVGLLDTHGKDLNLRLDNDLLNEKTTTRTLEIRKSNQSFCFVDVPCKPVPSLLRGFSAPVIVQSPLSEADQVFLLAHDSDTFNRWEAGQRLALNQILRGIAPLAEGLEHNFDTEFIAALGKTLDHGQLDLALIAETLSLPSETYVGEQMDTINVDGIHQSRYGLRLALLDRLKESLENRYRALQSNKHYQFTAEDAGRRSLKNLCLGYLSLEANEESYQRCLGQFHHADNMTDELAALVCITHNDYAERQQPLEDFYNKWQHEALVVNKWFSLQATSPLPDTLEQIRQLKSHPAFDMNNPNRVRALFGALCHANPVRFHDASGEGYALITDTILELNSINPQIAARLVLSLSRWKRYDVNRQTLMQTQLNRLMAHSGLSKDVYEIVAKSLD